jgi:hypothetical protein
MIAPCQGDLVVTRKGRVGMLQEVRRPPCKCPVAFGAAGPVGWFLLTGLRRATGREILDAGLDGVGCNQMNEVTAARRDVDG